MLSGMALEMYKAVGYMAKVICTDGNELIGRCEDFDVEVMNWRDNIEEPSLTMRSPSKNGGAAPGALVEVFQSEIQSVEILEERKNPP